ncbi:MAG: tetratricopeptide repeat protein [Syntrophothermus sp.]
MKKTGIAVLFFAALLIVSCSSSKEKMKTKIDGLEKRLYASSATSFDTIKGDSLLDLYTNYIAKFPGDTICAKYTYNAASLCMNRQQNGKAVELFNTFQQNYPKNPRAPVCMFLTGFIYENQMHDLQKAKEIYLQFLEKYPESIYAKDARSSLDNLGKTPEQMMAEFEQRQKEAGTAENKPAGRK